MPINKPPIRVSDKSGLVDELLPTDQLVGLRLTETDATKRNKRWSLASLTTYLGDKLGGAVKSVNGQAPDPGTGDVALNLVTDFAHLQGQPIDNPNLAAALGAKADLVSGKVPPSQLPSYVDDVLAYASLSAFPATGEDGKIYVAKDTGRQYRWADTVYSLLSDSGLTADQLAGLTNISLGPFNKAATQSDITAVLASLRSRLNWNYTTNTNGTIVLVPNQSFKVTVTSAIAYYPFPDYRAPKEGDVYGFFIDPAATSNKTLSGGAAGAQGSITLDGQTQKSYAPGTYVIMRWLAGNVGLETLLQGSVSGAGASYDDTALRAQIFGRNRGAWTANTAYAQYDFVTYNGQSYYAKAAFTSGASFDVSNWTAGTYQAVSNIKFGKGLRQRTNGNIEATALDYVTEQYVTYDPNNVLAFGRGFQYTVSGFTRLELVNTASADQVGFLTGLTNAGTGPVTVFVTNADSTATDLLTLQPQEYARWKWTAAGYELKERGTLNAPGTGGGGADLSNYYTKSQSDDRYQPKGGGGSTVIDYSNEIPVTADTNATPYKAYLLSGGGCKLILPGSAAVGVSVFVRVASDATGLFTVQTDDSTPVIVGQFWANETVTFRKLTDGWHKQAPDARAMSATISGVLNDVQSFPLTDNTNVRYPAVLESTGIAGLAPSGASKIVIQRTGRYVINSLFAVTGIQQGGYYQFIVFAGPHVVAGALVTGGVAGSTAYGLAGPTATKVLTAGTEVYCTFYSSTNGVATRSDNGELLPLLSVTELP